VTDERDVEALADRIRRRHGGLHVLVNSAGLRMDHIGGARAGYPYRVPFLALPIADWDRMIATNLRGPFLACRLLGPLVQAAGMRDGAAVVNVSAGAGIRGQAGRVPYSASKFGLEGLSQALAAEWRELNVAVNTIEPGVSVLTDDVKRGLAAAGGPARFARPEIMVPPTLFLAAQDATGLTGAHLNALAWLEERGLGDWARWKAD
jgi:NAD(P)-dependent dehydrogenase (short-subunit alcohol dehydrogenase family)